MGTIELAGKVKELKELQRMQEEVEAEMEAIKDTIKAELTARGMDELAVGEYRVRWSLVKSARLDTAALKKAVPEVYAAFAKTTESRRLSIA